MTSTNAPPPELQIQSSQDADAMILMLTGELDLQAAAQLSTAVDTALESALPLCLDLSKLRFMDSSGLAAIVRADRESRAVRQRMWLSGPTPQVRRLLEVTGLLDAFEIRG